MGNYARQLINTKLIETQTSTHDVVELIIWVEKLTILWAHLLCKSIIAVTTFDVRPLMQTTSIKGLYAKQTRFYD